MVRMGHQVSITKYNSGGTDRGWRVCYTFTVQEGGDRGIFPVQNKAAVKINWQEIGHHKFSSALFLEVLSQGIHPIVRFSSRRVYRYSGSDCYLTRGI
jgi:hypothetical protein